MAQVPLYIGIDGGGSKTALHAQADGLPLVEFEGAGTNVAALGLEEVVDRLESLILAACATVPEARLTSICAGLAGAGRGDTRAELVRRLRARLVDRLPTVDPDLRIRVLTDGPIALETAFGEGSGVVVMAGTGSIAFARLTDGSVMRVGGWGRLIGDDGSGYALGRQALRAAAASFEGGPDTLVARLFGERFDIRSRDGLLRRVYEDEWAPQHDPAALLLEAAEAGDAVARTLLLRECMQFVDQIRWLLNRLPDEAVTPRFGLVGGLFRQAVYRATLTEKLATAFPGWSVVQVEDSPAAGALRVARRATDPSR